FGNDMVDGGGISELGETIGLNPFVVNTTATQTVDFLDPSGIVSDRVTIPPFTARLFSDVPENLPLSGLPPIAPNAVRLTVAQSEAVDIYVSLASDSESGGNPSDTLSLNAMVD